MNVINQLFEDILNANILISASDLKRSAAFQCSVLWVLVIDGVE